MLICERCGCGYHTSCVKPSLQDIPKDAWYCDECLTYI